MDAATNGRTRTAKGGVGGGAGGSGGTDAGVDNVVFLRGRLAAASVVRVLPSGDEITAFRVTVDRPAGERVKVDSIDCSTSSARVLRVLDRIEPGAELEVTGRLKRRFWRSPSGPASRYEVDVTLARSGRRR